MKQSGGKVVTAWALEGDLDVSAIASNLVEIAWPPRSGRTLLVPELDRAGWFAPDEARRLVVTRAGGVRRPAGGGARLIRRARPVFWPTARSQRPPASRTQT